MRCSVALVKTSLEENRLSTKSTYAYTLKKLDVRKEKKVVFTHSRTRAAKANARENFRATDKVHVVKKSIRKYKLSSQTSLRSTGQGNFIDLRTYTQPILTSRSTVTYQRRQRSEKWQDLMWYQQKPSKMILKHMLPFYITSSKRSGEKRSFRMNEK